MWSSFAMVKWKERRRHWAISRPICSAADGTVIAFPCADCLCSIVSVDAANGQQAQWTVCAHLNVNVTLTREHYHACHRTTATGPAIPKSSIFITVTSSSLCLALFPFGFFCLLFFSTLPCFFLSFHGTLFFIYTLNFIHLDFRSLFFPSFFVTNTQECVFQ